MKTFDLEKTFKQYKKTTNMSLKEFRDWSKTKCSKMASLDRQPIKRNLMLLSTPKNKWTEKHIAEAKKQISFEKRHRKGKAGNIIKGCGISKRTIARKNWAYDPNK